MIRINPYSFLASLDEDYYFKARHSFAKMAPLYGEFKNNRLIQELTEVLCKDYVLNGLNHEDFSKILLAYFYDEFCNRDTVLRYLEWELNNVKKTGAANKFKERAGKYYDYLEQSYSKMKAFYRSKTDMNDEDVLEFIVDYTNVALKLFHSFLSNSHEEVITDYPDKVPEKTLLYFINVQFHLDRKGHLTAHDMNDEWKWFYYMLTWLIYFRICQDDAYDEESES